MSIKSLAHFQMSFSDYLLLSHKSPLYIQKYVLQFFSPTLWLVISSTLECLFEDKCLKFFYEVHCIIITLMFCAFCIPSKKSLPRRSFIALALTFTSMIHCKFILFLVQGEFQCSFPLPLDIQLFQHHLLKSLPFPIELPWHFC